MSKSRLHNLELIHLNIWLNLVQKEGYRICSRWVDVDNGYKCFKNDSYKQYINHIEQYGVHQTFVALNDLSGSFNPDNCYWATSEQDLTKHIYVPSINDRTKQIKNKNRTYINDNREKADIINLNDFKKRKERE